jgi:hypothetical protein
VLGVAGLMLMFGGVLLALRERGLRRRDRARRARRAAASTRV